MTRRQLQSSIEDSLHLQLFCSKLLAINLASRMPKTMHRRISHEVAATLTTRCAVHDASARLRTQHGQGEIGEGVYSEAGLRRS